MSDDKERLNGRENVRERKSGGVMRREGESEKENKRT